ncbi:hematopoietic SH2 domain-containing protein-like [Dryobates pubescens]|uniref:hematopoietic SH2 domain-containing protein-like n=1 Tax=Dryobates pubescens TaxID=118200 RepID=UPI0023B908E0|nr:hematopoietic SH2 domain-containing protein-like [Dryobates pubescens]
MIQMQPNVRYVILGEDRAHTSLTELVEYHQTVGIKPFMETLTVPCKQKSESLDCKDLEGLTLDPPAAKRDASPEEQPYSSMPSACKPAVQSGAIKALKNVWLRRSKNLQNEQSLNQNNEKTSSGKKRGRQQAFPCLHMSIRQAMQEIQQLPSAPWKTSAQSRCQPASTDNAEPQ